MIPKYQDIVELLKKGATVEAQEKIMELREAVMELQDENHSLRGRVRELEAEQRLAKSLTFDGAVYWQWLPDEAGDLVEKDGPYCQRCYDDEKKMVRLQVFSSSEWVCSKCKDYFAKK